jgi:hypothetical protein
LDKASKNNSILSLILPKSARDVIVVTGVSALILTRVVFSSTAQTVMKRIEAYESKPA